MAASTPRDIKKVKANRKARRAAAKYQLVSIKFSLRELSDIDYFVELVNRPDSTPIGEAQKKFNRNQVIRIAVAKYMEQVFSKAKALSDEYKKDKADAEAELLGSEEGESNGESQSGDSTGVAEAILVGTDAATDTLADQAGGTAEAPAT